ncbi:MAG: hypothetical protein ACRD0G_13780, partial [Acidimicrobiales bacterium]
RGVGRMVDSGEWRSTTELRDEFGISRQAISRAATALEPRGLARRVGRRWEIAAAAIAAYRATGRWTSPHAGHDAGASALSDQLETMQLRVELATAGEHAARLAERDSTIAALRDENARLRDQLAATRAELRALLIARAEALQPPARH